MTSLAITLRTTIERWTMNLAKNSELSRMAQAGKISERGLALYLESLRYLFVNSQRSLQLAAKRSEELGLPSFAIYFANKASEEQGHDGWAKDDLRRLPEASIANLKPAAAIVKLVELQRELIAEQHPMCFVVYALWAEYFTVLIGDEWIAALASCGYDRTQVSAIAKHVDADRDHAANGFNEVEELWNGDPAAALLVETIERASRVFEEFCDEICHVVRDAA
jgi:hypothetical protein